MNVCVYEESDEPACVYRRDPVWVCGCVCVVCVCRRDPVSVCMYERVNESVCVCVFRRDPMSMCV